MKRGQAAMEFLLTYGWAILVVLVVIGALSYFGVLDPTMLLPEKCVTSPEFGGKCTDFGSVANTRGLTETPTGYSEPAGDGVIFVILKNNIGKPITRATVESTNYDCHFGAIIKTYGPFDYYDHLKVKVFDFYTTDDVRKRMRAYMAFGTGGEPESWALPNDYLSSRFIQPDDPYMRLVYPYTNLADTPFYAWQQAFNTDMTLKNNNWHYPMSDTWASGQEATAFLAFCNNPKGKFKDELKITYSSSTGLDHVANVQVAINTKNDWNDI